MNALLLVLSLFITSGVVAPDGAGRHTDNLKPPSQFGLFSEAAQTLTGSAGRASDQESDDDIVLSRDGSFLRGGFQVMSPGVARSQTYPRPPVSANGIRAPPAIL